MNKKIIIFRVLIIVIILAIIGVISIFIFNKNNNDNKIINGLDSIIEKDDVNSSNSNDNDSNNDTMDDNESADFIVLHLFYKKSELYDINGNKTDYNPSFSSLVLSFHEKKVDVCFDECTKVSYTLNNNKIIINEGTDFSGEYELDDKEETAILKKKNDDGSTINYYFNKPKG